MRGGTSKGLFFHRRDLPAERSEWDALFLAALGSPDPHGRQLDGMGGGISSLSKVVVVSPSERPGVDLDYLFGQVAVERARVDYRSNCGNLSAAVGPFAVDEGLVQAADGEAALTLHNCNLGQTIEARFAVAKGRAEVEGDTVLDGVAGRGAPIHLSFLEPGGAVTGRLLPTGRVRDVLDVPGAGPIEATLIDASTALVIVRADALGPERLRAARRHRGRPPPSPSGWRRSAAPAPSPWGSRRRPRACPRWASSPRPPMRRP